jgi:hypothetical protein
MNVKTITHGRYKTDTYVVDDGVSGEALLIDPTEKIPGWRAVSSSQRNWESLSTRPE